MTTLTSYGTVAPHRQAELIRGMGSSKTDTDLLDDPDILALLSKIRSKAA